MSKAQSKEASGRGARWQGTSIKGKVLGPVHGIQREPQGATGGLRAGEWHDLSEEASRARLAAV